MRLSAYHSDGIQLQKYLLKGMPHVFFSAAEEGLYQCCHEILS